MPAFTTLTQHNTGSPSHSNQTRRRNKKHPNWKGGSKNVIFTDNMILYMENPIDSTKKILDVINEFGKTAGYRVNTQKSKAFLCTSNETAETEIRKKNPI